MEVTFQAEHLTAGCLGYQGLAGAGPTCPCHFIILFPLSPERHPISSVLGCLQCWGPRDSLCSFVRHPAGGRRTNSYAHRIWTMSQFLPEH